MSICEFSEKLQAPFEAEDIEWKPQTAGIKGDGKAYVLAVPYITNRAIQKKLDEVFGVFGWENAYKATEDGKGYLCGITVINGDKRVTRWDGAENTHIEPLKGGLSNSMKRAAVQFGIGRYLYQLPEFWAQCVPTDKSYPHDGYQYIIKKNKNNNLNKNIAWKDPVLPEWAQPKFDFNQYYDLMNDAETINDLKHVFAEAWRVSQVHSSESLAAGYKAAYDDKLYEIESLTAQNVAKETNDIVAWIDSQAEGFDMIPHEAAIETAYKSTMNALNKRIRDNNFIDKEMLSKKLHGVYLNRIKQFQKAQGEQQ